MAVAVITGGGGFLGCALGARYRESGDEVYLVDRDPAVIERARSMGAMGVMADVTDDDQLDVLKNLPRVDRLVCAVGSWPRISWGELDAATWRDLIEVNLTSAYMATRAVTEALIHAQGSVVFVGSAIALKGNPEMAHYAAAKAGLHGLAKSLALSLGPQGVRVNVVAPGLIETPEALLTWSEAQRKIFENQRAIPGPLTLDEVAEVVTFLTSHASRAVTGQVVVVDRGVVLQ
jgi:3-oxoacyl-[acyl-carrier protein] reductase